MAPELRADAEHMRQCEEIYPAGIGPMLAELLNGHADFDAVGMHERVPGAAQLDDSDVLVAWGHGCENWCWDEKAGLGDRVRSGKLQLVAMHSIWNSTVWPDITDLIGARCNLEHVREDVPIEIRPTEVVHPITDGVANFTLQDEIYLPPLTLTPDVSVLLTGRWEGHESPFAWTREVEKGRVVYLQPGHETLPVFRHPTVQQLLIDAIRWVARG